MNRQEGFTDNMQIGGGQQIVNVGDAPGDRILDGDHAKIGAAVAPLSDPEVDIGTIVVPFLSDAEATTESFVKTACLFADGAPTARALYFSRQPIPWGPGPRWHHIGIYAYRRAALARFVALPESPLEQREHLEQLRALEAGMRIDIAIIDTYPLGVDTPADLERARRRLGAQVGEA